MSGILRLKVFSACAAWLFVIVSCSSAMAISTLDDTLRDPPRIFRAPSSEPPNNAVHRDFGARRLEPRSQEQDVGPGPEGDPVTVPAASAPWTIAISAGLDLKQDYLCAGALVAPQWALTAAHCTYSLARRWPDDQSAYLFGHTGALASPGRRFNVREIVPYPDYDPRTLRHDLALVRFDAEGGAAGLPISLEGPPISEQVGAIGSILGWGISTEQLRRTHAEQLHVIQTAILDKDVCFSAANYPELRGTDVFCGRSLLKYHDICFRFGGSPMVFYDRKANLYLGGLVSWPATCGADRGKLNVYLDVQPYVPWIKRMIAGEPK
jgi:secreted trypsin-like serine protease